MQSMEECKAVLRMEHEGVRSAIDLQKESISLVATHLDSPYLYGTVTACGSQIMAIMTEFNSPHFIRMTSQDMRRDSRKYSPITSMIGIE